MAAWSSVTGAASAAFIARPKASSMRASENGFSMKSTTPERMASTAIGMSPWPVIITTGILTFRAASLATSSCPLISGMRTSVMTTPGLAVGRASRKAGALA